MNSRPIEILLVEDNADDVELTLRALKRNGFSNKVVTLRDGAQTNGVDFTLADKLAIARMLDDLGIDYVEAGYPGANPTDTNFFAANC